MKRFAIAAAVAAGLLWQTGMASAQYRTHSPTMSGRNYTMSGHIGTNHNHITPQRVGTYSASPYTGGVYRPGTISPYNAGAAVLPNGYGGFLPGPTVYPGGYYYNPSVWSGYGSSYGWRR